MKVDGISYRTIWINSSDSLMVIDQRALPHHFKTECLSSFEAVCTAIRNMTVRGAGLIGATAGYGMWMAAKTAASVFPALSREEFLSFMSKAGKTLLLTRPTAGNLARAVERQMDALKKSSISSEGCSFDDAVSVMRRTADAIADEDADFCRRIGEHGKEIIRRIAADKAAGEPVRILTHCNAGWLAFVDYGSALSPVYAAFEEGIPVYVWVDETRPRNQGAALTAWELARHGIPHALIPDNTGGHLMQHKMVDLVIVGADRVTRRGDTANKIGTYLKALAAQDNHVPFYVALPSTTFDVSLEDGLTEIPIEERDVEEVRHISGRSGDGSVHEVLVCPEDTPARNWAFDVTPARLITGFICERGVCPASEKGILDLFPDWKKSEKKQDDIHLSEEGTVKYLSRHTKTSLTPEGVPLLDILPFLDSARTFLHDHGLIGENEKGVAYGNISALLPTTEGREKCFLVSGTSTGKSRVLGASGYAVVTHCDVRQNYVTSYGPVPASSEAMTHMAIYMSNPLVRFVLHIHHQPLFVALLRENWLHTPSSVTYGTPEMAWAVEQLMCNQALSEGVFVTAGHTDGLFAFGSELEDTVNVIMRLLNRYCGTKKTLFAI